MTDPRIAAVLADIKTAEASLLATGETRTIEGGGRAPSRSARFRRATAGLHDARRARNRLFAELVGDADPVPVALIEQFGLTGREAVHVIDTARHGTVRLRSLLFGAAPTPDPTKTS